MTFSTSFFPQPSLSSTSSMSKYPPQYSSYPQAPQAPQPHHYHHQQQQQQQHHQHPFQPLHQYDNRRPYPQQQGQPQRYQTSQPVRPTLFRLSCPSSGLIIFPSTLTDFESQHESSRRSSKPSGRISREPLFPSFPVSILLRFEKRLHADIYSLILFIQTGSRGRREWSHGLCGCCSRPGICCYSCCCPCIVFSKVSLVELW